MNEFNETIDVKEDKKWTRKAFATVWAIVFVLVVVLKVIFWKVVEATVFEEIAKVILVAAVLGVLACVIFWVPITALRDARRKLYPEYGKDWFKQALKILFNKK